MANTTIANISLTKKIVTVACMGLKNSCYNIYHDFFSTIQSVHMCYDVSHSCDKAIPVLLYECRLKKFTEAKHA